LSTEAPQWIVVGRVSRAHGVRGEVAVQSLSQIPTRFEPGSRVFAGEDADRPLTVAHSRPHGGRVLVRFKEVPHRDAAEALRGALLFVPASSMPSLDDGEYWTHEVVGCEVFTDEGRSLGRIREIIQTQANDVWVTDGADGETLIPALKDVVESVDLAARRVVVREVSGLTAP
jgi:16S rRNA processing protein RimM